MKNLLIFTFIILFYYSCRKPEIPFATSVAGYCYDQNSLKPVADVKITIGWAKKKCGNCSFTSFGIVAQFVSDKNGFYSYKFLADDSNTYQVRGIKDSECYDVFNPKYSNYLVLGFPNNGDMLGRSFASINLHIKNINPFDSHDTIHIVDSKTWWGVRIGTNVDTQIFTTVDYGNSKTQFHWEVTKNGIKTNFHSDSIFIPPCDTTYYSIYY